MLCCVGSHGRSNRRTEPSVYQRSRTLRLTLLAPDTVEAILGGWADQRVMLERLERPLPVGWQEQRRVLH